LHRLPASLEYYKKSVNLAEEFLDPEHNITKLVTNARTKALLNSQNGHFKRKVIKKTPTKNTGRLIFKEAGRSNSPYLKHYKNQYI